MEFKFRLHEVVGIILLGAGLIGCLLPIIPGIPFLIGAAALLGRRHRWVKPWIDQIENWRAKHGKHPA